MSQGSLIGHGPWLAEVIMNGEGVERPFCCEAHPDEKASASVNVAKMVWYCYACHAKGRVDSKAVLKDETLLAMLEPEKAVRPKQPSWLMQFGHGYYWNKRFEPWLNWVMSFGEDPFTADATFPVYTPAGLIAGVGRRREHGDMRYLYPRDWSSSRVLAGYEQVKNWPYLDVVVLGEGAADGGSIIEAGVPGLGCYGAGLHAPQIDLVMRLAPKLVLLGFDADDAGRAASERSALWLEDLVLTEPIDWAVYGAKDPAELGVEARLEAITEAVRRSSYSPSIDLAGRALQVPVSHRVAYEKAMLDA